MDRNMAWAPHPHHRRGHSLGGGVVREKDEDLALFKDMGKRDKSAPFLHSNTDDQLLDAVSLSTKFGGLSHPHSAAAVERKGIGAELLNSDADKTDYDWLMTPPGTPLFPSLDADSPALQQGALMNRSLAAIKTSRVGTAPRARSPAPNVNRGNPSPSRRPSTPQAGQPTAPTRSQSQRVAATNNTNRPATPIRSSTPSSRASPSAQATRPSTPIRQQSSAPRPVTPLGARPATPTRRPATPTNSSSRASNCTVTATATPTLRRSISSSTSRHNPSPTRSTGSTATSTAARGVSPARSSSSVRGVSPAPTSRGRSPSPSLRAPYPVDASDDIPPNLRTTSDRPSSAQRRALGYGASPGEGRSTGSAGDPLRRTISPARSITPSSGLRGRASRAASSDSESSFDNCSQSGLSNYGLATPERSGSRGRVFGRGPGVDYVRSSSSLQQKVRRSAGATTTSPQFGPSVSKKSFESAAREYHRGQVAAFRPLMTNSSISTFYSSRASGLLRRPLTPSSTASSSEHGATVAHDSDEDVGSSHWKPSSAQQASGTHSPLHLFDKSLRDAHDTGILLLDSSSIVDNDELGSFFTAPEPRQVECMDFKAGNHRKEIELESQELVRSAELNWLTSRNEHEDSEYLRPRDIGKDVDKGKQGSSGLEKIRDKLRHLKSTADNEEAESASRVQQAQSVTDSLCSLRAPTALEISTVDGDVMSDPLQGASCDECDHRNLQGGGETRHGCHCSATLTATTSQALQRHEGKSGRPTSLAEASSSRTHVENAESIDSKSVNMVYGKERDIWYIYRHSSEYEAQVAETKMEIDPPQILAKEVHTRTSPTSVSAQRELTSHGRENTSPTVYIGESSGHKEKATMENISTEASGGERLISTLIESANVALKGKEVDQHTGRLAAIGEDIERKGLEEYGSLEGGAVQKNFMEVPCAPERANEMLVLDELCENESTQACSSSENLCKSPQNSRMPALVQSSSVAHRANTMPQRSVEAVEKLEISVQPASQGGGHKDYDVAHCSQVSPIKIVALHAEEESHFNEEASEKGPPSACTEAPWNEDHASVKKVIWQEEDLQPQTQLGSQPEAGTVQSRADEHERTCREGDEEKFGWGKGNVEDIIFAPGFHRDGSVESQSQVALTHEPKSTCTDDSGSVCFEPVKLVGRKFLLTGEVHIDSALYATTHLFHDSLLIKIQSSDGRVLALDNPARLISEPDDVNSYAVYEYSHWAEVGEQLTFSAHHERKEGNLSAEILFYPKEHHVHISTGEKQPQIPEFQGCLGMQVKNSRVAPALDGVQITVVAEKETPAGGLKAGEIAASTVTDTTYLSQTAVAGFHPSEQRNPDLLLNSPDACVMQSKTPVVEENNAAKTGVRETQVRNLPSQNGEFEQSNSKVLNDCKGAEQSLGATLHETTSTADHFDYVFQCAGSKKDPPAEILNSTNYAIANPDSINSVNQSNGITKGSIVKSQMYQNAVKIPPVSQNSKCTPRADSELPVVMAVKEEIVENAESPSPGATRKHMSSFKFSHRKSTNSEPKRSNTTLGSNASKLGITVGNGHQQSEHSPGSKKTMNNKASVNGKPAAASSPSPQLNKGRSVRAASPARLLAAARPSEPVAGGNGEVVPPEEPSIHSRFSNITVRSGSDTENFDWGPSSLEETSSRCGSSEGTNPASMAVLSPNFGCHEDNYMANEDHDHDRNEDVGDDEEEASEEQKQMQRSSLLNRHSDSADGRSITNPRDSVPLEIFIPAAGHGPPVRGGPASSTSTSSVINNNYAPKQNLDKLSEKLEQLETFGARVMLRNPQQQFLHSPPQPRHGHGHEHDPSPSTKKQQADASLEEAEEDRINIPRSRQQSHHTLRLDSGTRSAHPVDMKMSPLPSKRSNKCRCTIL